MFKFLDSYEDNAELAKVINRMIEKETTQRLVEKRQ
jgi:hypothetical protein